MTTKKSKFRKTWKAIAFAICIIIFLVLTKLLLADSLAKFDNFVYSIIEKMRCKPLTFICKAFSSMVEGWFIALVAIIVMVVSKNKKKTFYIALNILICYFLNCIAKAIFERPRPLGINLITEKGFSFPSGHAMLSTAFYGYIAYVIAHLRIKKRYKKIYLALFTIQILSIGFSRIYLGVHYASDVLAGFALGFAYLILYIVLFYKKMESK